jgi:hypothetical protein
MFVGIRPQLPAEKETAQETVKWHAEVSDTYKCTKSPHEADVIDLLYASGR